MWSFAKKQSNHPSIHLDHASGPEYDDKEKVKFDKWISSLNGQIPEICCDRFIAAIDEKEIKFAYADTLDVDETGWYIEGMWHIYYCPFCGKNIKGGGFGSFDRKRPEETNGLL